MQEIRVVVPVMLVMTILILMQFHGKESFQKHCLETVEARVYHHPSNHVNILPNIPVLCPIEETEIFTWSANQTENSNDRNKIRETNCKLRAIGGQQNQDYGAWKLCETGLMLASKTANKSQDNALVYSFGLGRDTSFDEDIIKSYGAIVHGFDPTPGAVTYARERAAFLPDCFFALHPFGLNDKDGEIKMYPPENPNHISHNQVARAGARPVAATLLRLATIMHLLGHRHIHILKMDVEGAEFGVLDSLLSLGEGGSSQEPDVPFDQLCVEYHPNIHPGGPAAGVAAIKRITAALKARGFALVASNSAHEYSYARLAEAEPGSR